MSSGVLVFAGMVTVSTPLQFWPAHPAGLAENQHSLVRPLLHRFPTALTGSSQTMASASISSSILRASTHCEIRATKASRDRAAPWSGRRAPARGVTEERDLTRHRGQHPCDSLAHFRPGVREQAFSDRRRRPCGRARPTARAASPGGWRSRSARDSSSSARLTAFDETEAGKPCAIVGGDLSRNLRIAAIDQDIGDRLVELLAPGDRRQMRLTFCLGDFDQVAVASTPWIFRGPVRKSRCRRRATAGRSRASAHGRPAPAGR